MKKILIIVCILILNSCVKEKEIQIISSKEMFDIKQEDYYVLVYLNGCVACRDVKLRISKMNDELKEKIYYVDLELNKNLSSDCFRSNLNCMNYLDIKIKWTPTLLYIKNKIVIEEYIKSDKIFAFFDFLENRI